MLFKKIKFIFFSSVYSKLINVLRKTSRFFSFAYIQDIYTDKAVYTHKNMSPSDGDNCSPDEDEFYKIAGAPQHWLALIKRNKITLHNFSRQSYRNRLPVKKKLPQKESIEAIKTMSNAINTTRENMSNAVKVSKPLSQYIDKPKAYQSNNYLTNDIGNENIKPRIRLKSAAQSLFRKSYKMIKERVQNAGNIAITQAWFQIETKNRKNWKDKSEHSKLIKNSSDIQAQINIASPVNKVAKSQVNIISLKQQYDSRLKNDQKNKSNITQKDILSEKTKKKNVVYRNKMKSEFMTANAIEAESNGHNMQYLQNSMTITTTTEETPVSCWQELPEDVWDEMKTENVFTILPLSENGNSDIRKLLWNG